MVVINISTVEVLYIIVVNLAIMNYVELYVPVSG